MNLYATRDSRGRYALAEKFKINISRNTIVIENFEEVFIKLILNSVHKEI